MLATQWYHYECFTRGPWPKFSRSNIWNVSISKTVRAGVKLRAMTFIEIDICHRRLAAMVAPETATYEERQREGWRQWLHQRPLLTRSSNEKAGGNICTKDLYLRGASTRRLAAMVTPTTATYEERQREGWRQWLHHRPLLTRSANEKTGGLCIFL